MTPEAREDLLRLVEFFKAERSSLAVRMSQALALSVRTLSTLPFASRVALGQEDASLRELVVPFSGAGYVILFRISAEHVSILAVRHQREEDYH